MKAALVVHETEAGLEANLAAMERAIGEAAGADADLVVFPEAAPTGLENNDDPEHDLPLGQPIPGDVTQRLAAAVRRHGVPVAFGLLERDGGCLYDSAVVLDPQGCLALHYRRNQPQWHGRDADPAVYCQGDRIDALDTPFGRWAVLLCGDLFDDGIVERTRALRPDLLLLPFARNFGDGSFDDARWLRDEQPEYAARAAVVGCTALMVNSLDDPETTECPAFGGALAVAPTGEVLARKPLGQPGILFADV